MDSREDNELADYLNRITDYDWNLDGAIFQQLDLRWGPHIIDRFTSHYNTQLPCFNSWFWNPGTEGVDAFTCDWSNDINWLCPPVFLIPHDLTYQQVSCQGYPGGTGMAVRHLLAYNGWYPCLVCH